MRVRDSSHKSLLYALFCCHSCFVRPDPLLNFFVEFKSIQKSNNTPPKGSPETPVKLLQF